MPLVANLLNYSAKKIDRSFYDYKGDFIQKLVELHPKNWTDGEVVYFETPYGQVSFHSYENTDYSQQLGINPSGRKWHDNDSQENALKLIYQAIEDIENQTHDNIHK